MQLLDPGEDFAGAHLKAIWDGSGACEPWTRDMAKRVKVQIVDDGADGIYDGLDG
jgi:hypothetical protein